MSAGLLPRPPPPPPFAWEDVDTSSRVDVEPDGVRVRVLSAATSDAGGDVLRMCTCMGRMCRGVVAAEDPSYAFPPCGALASEAEASSSSAAS